MKSYYKNRAPLYDQVYLYPERQQDLRFLEKYIPEQFTGRNVLEIAAGTGYWSQFIAAQAASILMTDITVEALSQIKARHIKNSASIRIVDAYSLGEIPGEYNGTFAGLWLSHVPRQRLHEFLSSLHQLLSPGAVVVFIDNSSAQCVRLPISYTDDYGNSYQDRKLEDGTVYRVLKNFPTQKELMEMTSKLGTKHEYIKLENYWLFQYIAN